MLDACTSSVASIRRPTLRPSRTSPRMLPSGWLPSSRRPTSRRRPTGQSRHASSTLSPTTSPQRSRARPDVCAVQGDNPAAGLTTTARALACDLIVIGATARGRVADALRGGLRDTLVEQADCPVTVVPPGAAPPTGDCVAVATRRSAPPESAAAAAAHLASALKGWVISRGRCTIVIRAAWLAAS
jgi:Universal stress protein family